MFIPDNANPLPNEFRGKKPGFLSGAYQLTDRETYYQASATKYPAFPMLRGDKKCDVVVVGAGYAGLSAAIELARAGVNVMVVEQSKVGYGCSGRNGGQLIRGWHWEQKDIEKHYGKTVGDMAWAIGVDSAKLVKDRIKEFNIDADYKAGWNYAPITQKQDRYLQEVIEALAKRNYTIKYHAKETVHKKLATSRYISFGEDKNSGHLHPLKLTIGYALAAKKLGAQIFEFTPAVDLDMDRGIVTTPFGTITADTILLAGGAYLNWKRRLVKKLYRTVMPVGSYVVATEPLPDKLNPVLDDQAYCDLNWALDYFRMSADNRMLFGGRATYSTLEPQDVKSWMKPRMVKVFPQLKDVKIDYAWGGLIDITMNRMPDMGFLTDKTIYVQGFSGQGVNMAPICGKILAETILAAKRGEKQRQFEMIRKFNHRPFPGGMLRTPLLVLAMAYYRLKDKI
ncbi:MAG: FAD-binding oxidoreductase [Hydrotalea sp.]|nr:FAD-binding oxidoreductase [Hydrotalea sp.]